jgi:hypothetical protein
MNWVRALAAVLVVGASPAWAATLTWNASTGPDLVGYNVYQCSLQPCTPSSGNASLLVTLGNVTSFNIGTPAVTEYYFVTAYDSVNLESSPSNVATYTPGGTPPPVVPPAIGASPTSLSFAATQGGANPATQTVSISNTGGGTLSWTASDNAAWLTLSPASGTGNGAVTVTVSTGSLTAGTYSAMVAVVATGAPTITVPVTFTVSTAPVPPAIGASPTSLSFGATQGGANPATQTVTISNTGGGTLSWTASDNAAWLTLSPASGTGNGAVTVTVSTGSLTAGTYSATVAMNAAGAAAVTVPVTFTVVATAPAPPPPPPPPSPPPPPLVAPPTPGGLHITAVQ